ncbi:hypothetical protein LTR85_010883 [Meristemomyces frigidus]|nr:hypothetical protein LTR85_010883 [Meristemomyces frigidus]
MADVNISSPPNIRTTQQRAPSSPQQTPPGSNMGFVNLHGITPLYGSDEYTKMLMNRIATGEATSEERARWEQHVAVVKSKPLASVHNNTFSQSTAYPTPPPAALPRTSRPIDPRTGVPLEDYQMQLMLLEQQNKKRLIVARQEQDANNERANGFSQMQMQPQASMPSEPTHGQTPSGMAALEDYHMHLAVCEQQNNKRKQEVLAMRSARKQQTPSTQFGNTTTDADRALASFDFDAFLNGTEAPPKVHEARLDRSNASVRAPYMPTEADNRNFRASLAATEIAPEAPRFKQATRKNAAPYTEPFLNFLTDNPTVFHAVDAIKKDLKDAGFSALSERDGWDIKPSGSYFVERNGSSLIAFTVGANYKPGNGAAILAGHVDALTAKLKPISQVPNKAGYLQLGIAPYAGAPNTTWWDRDLSVGGRVLVKEGDKIVTKLVKLDWPIARIPTLAPHFGAAASGPFNPETQMVPIIGLEGTSTHASEFQTAEPFSQPSLLGGVNGPVGSFVQTQPPALVKAIGKALGLSTSTYANMVNWELELFDVQPATVGGLDKEFIFAGRIDDKLCSWAAVQALIEAKSATHNSSMIKVVGLFDDEEIGSQLRQGARSNFLPATIERAVGSLADHHPTSDLMGRTYANSFLVSSDVTHAVNPNFLGAYLENHAPHLNVGVVVSADSNGHMTTDSVSTALFKRCADKVGAKLQVFQIRNDSRSGGTVGPMLSSMTGIRAIDAGIPQLSMHSIRATTGALDPGLGVLMFVGFLNGFEQVDKEFTD